MFLRVAFLVAVSVHIYIIISLRCEYFLLSMEKVGRGSLHFHRQAVDTIIRNVRLKGSGGRFWCTAHNIYEILFIQLCLWTRPTASIWMPNKACRFLKCTTFKKCISFANERHFAHLCALDVGQKRFSLTGAQYLWKHLLRWINAVCFWSSTSMMAFK